jgi:hypothetical protein
MVAVDDQGNLYVSEGIEVLKLVVKKELASLTLRRLNPKPVGLAGFREPLLSIRRARPLSTRVARRSKLAITISLTTAVENVERTVVGRRRCKS